MIRRPKLLVFALLLIAFGAAVLSANATGRAERLADELVEATDVLPENEGRLVIISGTPQLADDGVIVDEEAALEVRNVVFYSRVPLQKVYVRGEREVVIDKGDDLVSEVDDKKRTEYYLASEWIGANHKRDEAVTFNFKRYENPAPVKMSAFHASGDLRVSGFRISAGDVSRYLTTRNGWFTQEQLAEACKQFITRSEIDLRAVTDDDGRGMLSSGDEIGDVHVLFSYQLLEDAEEVTLIGRQQGDQLVLEEDGPVSEAEQVQAGVVTREEFLEVAGAEDTSSSWMGAGFLVVGAALVLASLNLGKG